MPALVEGILNLNKSPVAVIGPLFNTGFRPRLRENGVFAWGQYTEANFGQQGSHSLRPLNNGSQTSQCGREKGP